LNLQGQTTAVQHLVADTVDEDVDVLMSDFPSFDVGGIRQMLDDEGETKDLYFRGVSPFEKIFV